LPKFSFDCPPIYVIIFLGGGIYFSYTATFELCCTPAVRRTPHAPRWRRPCENGYFNASLNGLIPLTLPLKWPFSPKHGFTQKTTYTIKKGQPKQKRSLCTLRRNVVSFSIQIFTIFRCSSDMFQVWWDLE